MAEPAFVCVHALEAGHLTLPERLFVSPLEDTDDVKTVPSLSFLIQHTDAQSEVTSRIVFDLGIRRRVEDYSAPIYQHALSRQPLSGSPDVVTSLAKGGLTPQDIDMVMFSHLHWDHIGTPSDMPDSTYIIGPGARALIEGTSEQLVGSHHHFEPGILDSKRTFELRDSLSPVEGQAKDASVGMQRVSSLLNKPWQQKGYFDAAIDMFGDGSLYIVSAPGHLAGHINLLCRLKSGRHVYLAGDACHDARLLRGEKDIATWSDPNYPGVVCCIHQDQTMAKKTLETIRKAMEDPGELKEVEVILAHDDEWASKAKLANQYFPGALG